MSGTTNVLSEDIVTDPKAPLILSFCIPLVVASACGDSGGEATVDGGTAMDATGDAATSDAECVDALGCATYAADEPIVVSSILPGLGNLGDELVQATQLALDDWGTIEGRALVLTVEPGGCDPTEAVSSATRIVRQDSVVAVVGTTCSSAALSAAPVITAGGYVMVSPSNTTPELTDPLTHEAGYLRVAWNDADGAIAFASFSRNDLGAMTSAVIHENTSYSEKVADAFVDAFQDAGGTHLSTETIAPSGSNADETLAAIAAAGPPDVLFLVVDSPAGQSILERVPAVDALADTTLAASDLLLDGFEDLDIAVAEGLYFVGADTNIDGPANDDFVAAFLTRHGHEPSEPFPALAYDATTLILHAIERVATVDGERLRIGRQALRDALYDTQDLQGIYGTMTCDDDGQCTQGRFVVLAVRDGRLVVVAAL